MRLNLKQVNCAHQAQIELSQREAPTEAMVTIQLKGRMRTVHEVYVIAKCGNMVGVSMRNMANHVQPGVSSFLSMNPVDALNSGNWRSVHFLP